MKRSENCVFVVDDDPSIRNALKNLLRSVGLETRLFASAREFLDYGKPEITSCLILDVRMPGMSGLDLQKELAKADIPIPIIFITAHGDIPMAVRAMKAGAVDFMPKPFRDQDMLDAIQLALAQDRERRERENDVASLRTRFQELTPRERELLPLVVSGRSNKEIAAAIGTSEITVKVHRGNLMRKMKAESFAELLHMAADLKIPFTKFKA